MMPLWLLGLQGRVESESSEIYAAGTWNTQNQKAREESDSCGLSDFNHPYAIRGQLTGKGLSTEVNWLWWRAENQGFSYGLNEESEGQYRGRQGGTTAFPTGFNIGKVLRISPKWTSGVRVGVGKNFYYDRWTVFGEWTGYKTATSSEFTRDDLTTATFDGLYPQWPLSEDDPSGSFYGPYRSVTASWKLNYNVVDLLLKRAYFMTKRLSLQPYCGVRAAWIHQRFLNDFTAPLSLKTDDPNSPFYTNANFNGENHWQGVGPRAGLQGNWRFSKRLGLVSKISGALLMGQSKMRVVTTVDVNDPTEVLSPNRDRIDRKFTDTFYQLVPNVQVFLGMSWEAVAFHNTKLIGVQAGWEANYWDNQFSIPPALRRFVPPLPTVSNQPVTMEGVTVDIYLDF